MFLIYSDRAKFSMTKEEELYESFYTLSPSQFRKLIKIAAWFNAEQEETITTCREVPNKMFFILEGTASINRERKHLKWTEELSLAN